MGTDELAFCENGGILPGTLEMFILKMLGTEIRLNGAEIVASIHHASEGAVQVKEGALYPALHRLEARGFLQSEPGLSQNKRHAKFYRVTAAGKNQLEEECIRWTRIISTIAKILQKPASETASASSAQPVIASPSKEI